MICVRNEDKNKEHLLQNDNIYDIMIVIFKTKEIFYVATQ